MVVTIRDGERRGKRVRIGAPEESLTPNAGMAPVGELMERLRLVEEIDAAAGPIKTRARGHGLGGVLVAMATAQLAGQGFLVGLDRVRADVAGQALAPVPGLATSTARGLARRVGTGQWAAVETGVAAVHERMLAMLPAPRSVPTIVVGHIDTPSSLSSPRHGSRVISRIPPRLTSQPVSLRVLWAGTFISIGPT